MGMRKSAPVEAPVTPQIPVTAVETPIKQSEPVVEVKVTKVKPVKAVAYGRELSDYELQKDRKIGVAGVVQAIIGSDWYSQQASLTDLSNKESVIALREFAVEEVTYWLEVIKGKSEC